MRVPTPVLSGCTLQRGGGLGVVGTQAVAGVCEVIFAHKVLPESVFADNSLSLILVLVSFSP